MVDRQVHTKYACGSSAKKSFNQKDVHLSHSNQYHVCKLFIQKIKKLNLTPPPPLLLALILPLWSLQHVRGVKWYMVIHGGISFLYWSNHKCIFLYQHHFLTLFLIRDLCNRWQMWNDTWFCQGGISFQHRSSKTSSPQSFDAMIYNISLHHITSPGSRCLMGSKSAYSGSTPGFTVLEWRGKGSVSSRVWVFSLQYSTIPPHFYTRLLPIHTDEVFKR